MVIIKLDNVTKIYNDDCINTVALKNINLQVEKGEMVAIMGTSGSGKSTLLNVIGFIDSPTEGQYFFDEVNYNNKSSRRLAKIRNENFGFVFQHFALIKEYKVIDNVKLPLNLRNLSNKEKNKKAIDYLKMVGLEEYKNKLPSRLSGGQQQRVAIARALAQETDVILADEPTGALDHNTGNEIMNILKSLNKDGKTVIIVTHDDRIAEFCNRKISMYDGEIVSDIKLNS